MGQREARVARATLCLNQCCKVLLGAQHTRNHNGGSQAIVALERDPGLGWICHLPKYLFMDVDHRVVLYACQQPICYHCETYNHICAHCTTELCSKRRVHGHRTATCSLCWQVGHAYHLCSELETNQSNPEAVKREKAHMREAEQR